MKKIISLVTAIVALCGIALTGCKFGLAGNNVTDKVSITLSESALVFNSAIADRTSKLVTADVKNSDANVIWGSQDTNVADVSYKGDGREATILVKGEGSTKVVAYTEDNKAIAYCYVDVQLTKVECDPVSDLYVDEVTGSSVILSWEDSKNLTSVKIDVYKGSEAVGSVTVPYGKQTAEIKRLLRKTTYTFNVYGVMNGKLSSVVSVNGKTDDDTEAPEDVKNVKVKTYDHSLSVSWLPPDDDDINKIYFTAKNLKNIDGSSRENVTKTYLYTELQEIKIDGLKAGTDYEIEIATEDISGNKQTEPYVDLISTEEDVTSTAKVTSLEAYNLGDYIKLSWVDPEDVDFSKVKIVSEGLTISPVAKGVKTINISAAANGASFGNTYYFKVYAVDYDGNESEVSECSVDYEDIAPVTVVAAKSHYTNGILVSWTNTNADEYIVSVYKSSDSTLAGEKKVLGGSGKAIISGLTTGENYYATVKATGQSISAAVAQTEAVETEKVVWHLLSGYGSNRYIGPVMSSEITTYDVACPDKGTLKYEYWIIYPAFSGNPDYFSLEACDASGNGSGWYMYLDSNGRSMTNTTHKHVWTYGDPSKPILMVSNFSESYIREDRKDASFKFEDSVVKSGYYVMYDEYQDYFVNHASLTFGGKKRGTTEDKDGCSAIKVEVVK